MNQRRKEDRGYQTFFYHYCSGVRDKEERLRKAAKIAYALESLSNYPLSSATCLDAGCSSGTITNFLASLFAQTIGLDYDAVALANINTTSKNKPVFFIRGDLMRIPLADGSIDVVICAQVYEHVPSDEVLFAELHRVLKTGGIVFFSGPNKLFPIEPHYFLPFLHWLPYGWADKYLHVLKRGEHYYERLRTFWELRRLISQFGFEVRDVTAELFVGRYLARWGLWSGLWKFCSKVLIYLTQPLLPNFNWILYKSGKMIPRMESYRDIDVEDKD